MSYARRKDNTHKAIAEGCKAAGFSVADTSRLGDDFPDLVIGKHGLDAKVECKTPRGKKTAAQLLSAGQKEFKDEWKGAPVIVAYSLEDVIYGFNMLMKRNHWSK